MKIECTKYEWAILMSLLDRAEDASTGYDFPNFTCDVIDREYENNLLSIEGTFTDDN